MSNYTKGEWKVVKSPESGYVIVAEDTLICREVRHFNAHLIAAAPDMYEAIKMTLDPCYQSNGHATYPAIIKLRDALAKAENK